MSDISQQISSQPGTSDPSMSRLYVNEVETAIRERMMRGPPWGLATPFFKEEFGLVDLVLQESGIVSEKAFQLLEKKAWEGNPPLLLKLQMRCNALWSMMLRKQSKSNALDEVMFFEWKTKLKAKYHRDLSDFNPSSFEEEHYPVGEAVYGALTAVTREEQDECSPKMRSLNYWRVCRSELNQISYPPSKDGPALEEFLSEDRKQLRLDLESSLRSVLTEDRAQSHQDPSTGADALNNLPLRSPEVEGIQQIPASAAESVESASPARDPITDLDKLVTSRWQQSIEELHKLIGDEILGTLSMRSSSKRAGHSFGLGSSRTKLEVALKLLVSVDGAGKSTAGSALESPGLSTASVASNSMRSIF